MSQFFKLFFLVLGVLALVSCTTTSSTTSSSEIQVGGDSSAETTSVAATEEESKDKIQEILEKAKSQQEEEEEAEAAAAAAEAEAAERAENLETINNLMSDKVFFEYDESIVDSEYFDSLQEHADYLNLNPDSVLEIQGHTDDRGSTDYNQALGERRAQAVSDELLDLGVDEVQLIVISFGESRPIEYGQDELSWSLNRRVEFLYQ